MGKKRQDDGHLKPFEDGLAKVGGGKEIRGGSLLQRLGVKHALMQEAFNGLERGEKQIGEVVLPNPSGLERLSQ